MIKVNELMRILKECGVVLIDLSNNRENCGCVNPVFFDEIADVSKYKDYNVKSICPDTNDPQIFTMEIEKPEENKYSVDKAKIDLPKFKDYLKNCIEEGLEKFSIEPNIFDGIEREDDLK